MSQQKEQGTFKRSIEGRLNCLRATVELLSFHTLSITHSLTLSIYVTCIRPSFLRAAFRAHDKRIQSTDLKCFPMFFPVITPFVVDFFFPAADSCERVFMAVERCILNRFKVNYSACVYHNKGTRHT